MITENMVAAAGRVAAKREHAHPYAFDFKAYKAQYFERHLAKYRDAGIEFDNYRLAALEVLFDKEYYKQYRKLRGY